MKLSDLLIMIIGSSDQGIPGKTCMQKIAYFSSKKLNFNAGFFAHFYGPYSKLVANELNLLKTFDFIRETKTLGSNGYYYSTFELTNDGQQKFTNLIDTNEMPIIKKVTDICHQYEMDYNLLSYAAKIFLILEEESRRLSYDEIHNLAQRHNWNLNDDEINAATHLLLELEMIKSGD